MDYFGTKEVAILLTATYGLNYFVFYAFAKDSELAYVACYGILIFNLHALFPVMVGVCTLMWEVEGRRLFALLIPFFTVGAIIGSVLVGSCGYLNTILIFGIFCSLVPFSFLFIRKKLVQIALEQS